MKDLIGKRVTTYDGHSGIVIKHFKPTGRGTTVHIEQDDGRIWYCPDSDIATVEKQEDMKIITDERDYYKTRYLEFTDTFIDFKKED